MRQKTSVWALNVSAYGIDKKSKKKNVDIPFRRFNVHQIKQFNALSDVNQQPTRVIAILQIGILQKDVWDKIRKK